MDKEILKFWQQNNTPVSLMMRKASLHGVNPKQVQIAAEIVYEEVQELIYNVPEIKPYWNGKYLEKIVLLHNHLRPNILGWRVYELAKFVELDEETGEPIQKKKGFIQWIKSIKWEIDPWQ